MCEHNYISTRSDSVSLNENTKIERTSSTIVHRCSLCNHTIYEHPPVTHIQK